jgi:hypothetical protein
VLPLSLSQACLGKLTVSSIKWLKRDAFAYVAPFWPSQEKGFVQVQSIISLAWLLMKRTSCKYKNVYIHKTNAYMNNSGRNKTDKMDDNTRQLQSSPLQSKSKHDEHCHT